MISRSAVSAGANLYNQSVISFNISGAFRAYRRCQILALESWSKMSKEPHHFDYPYDTGEDEDAIDDGITPICIMDMEELDHQESMSKCVLASRSAATDYISLRA